MKHVWKMLLAAVLCLTLFVPAGAMAEEAEVRYGVVTDNQVNVRKTAGMAGTIWFKVDEGHVAQITGEESKDGDLWYKVSTEHPTPNGRTYVGYILEDFFREMTAAEVEAYLQSQVTPAPDSGEEDDSTEMKPSTDDALNGTEHDEYNGTEVVGAKGKVTADANFRSQPTTKEGEIYAVIAKGTEVDITAIPLEGDTNGWYRVSYQGKNGYVFYDLVELLDAGTEATPAPGYGTEVTGVVGEVTIAEVNVRSEPRKDATNANVLFILYPGLEFEILTVPDQITDNDWYRVRYHDKVGYIQSTLVRILSGDAPTPTPGYGTEVTGVVGEVTTDQVNFRSEPKKDTNNANVIQKLKAGVQVEILTVPDGTTTDDWYRVRYNARVGYVQAPFIRIVSGETPTPTLPGDDGDDDVTVNATGMVTTDKVNFRMNASITSTIYGKLNTGDVVQLLSIPTKIDADHWYKVFYDGKTGYIQSPFIRVLTVDEDDLPAADKYGYAKLLEDSVNLRATAGGDTIVQWKGKGSMLRITGEPVFSNNYDWYPVYYPTTHAIYYVREDVIQCMLVEDGNIVPAPVPESPYGYIITTEKGVNLRIQPGQASIAQVPKNTILACVGPAKSPAESGTSYTWYMVKYSGMTGYLRGDCVRVCTSTGGSIVDPDPEETTPPADEEVVIRGYIRLTKDNVNLRKEPLGASQVQLPIDLILPIVGDTVPEGKKGQFCWYKVKTADGLDGYIRGDCAVLCTDAGAEVTPTPPPSGEEVTGVKGKLLKNTNFRDKAGYDGNINALIPAGTIVDVLEIPENKVNGWYKIRYEGETGYVLASLLQLVTDEDLETEKPPVSAYGYVMINDEKVNFRREASTGDNVIKWLDKGTVWPMTGVAVDKGGVRWYPIEVNGQKGYVHGDFSFKLSPTQEESYLAGNGVPEETPNPEDVLTSYIITTYDAVNLRESYSLDAPKPYQVDKGTVMPFNDTKTIGTVTWYSIVYDNQPLWVHGDFVKVMTLKEYQDWVAANPDAVPDPDANLGYLKLIMDNVYIRNAAAGTAIDQLRLGTVLPYYTEKVPGGNYYWYRVKTPAGEYGYIRSDMVAKCDENGDPLPTPTPDLGDLSAAPKMQQETSYYSLKVGDTGVRVHNLVQELINQGYYTGDVTSNYTTAVVEAVKLFQTVNGLTVDGKAGSATQHALFGTRPIGAGDTSNLEFSIYPVEKIDWYTGGIQEMLPRGAKFKIYDVKTGIVWWARRQAGSRHMDIETLTAADSKRLCQIYGVSNLQQIVDDNMWERRPCLITIGTRTFAASLDGMQHGDDTIANNGMDGQVCLHFTNSEGHASQTVSTSHKAAIDYAYNHCPAGKK